MTSAPSHATNKDNQSKVSPNITKAKNTSFPTVSLADAFEMIETASKYGRVHSIGAIAGYLGHETHNSGPFNKKLAAFREWQLLSGTGNSIGITDAGWTYAFPANDEERQAVAQQVFKNSSVFLAVYKNAAIGQSLKLDSIANHAIASLGVSAAAKNKFIQSFKESAIFAGLAEAEGEDRIKFLPEGAYAVNVNLHDDQQDQEQTSKVKEGLGSEKSSAPKVRNTQALLTQKWESAKGTIVFEIYGNAALSSESFSQLGKIVQEIEGLAKKLGINGEEIDASE